MEQVFFLPFYQVLWIGIVIVYLLAMSGLGLYAFLSLLNLAYAAVLTTRRTLLHEEHHVTVQPVVDERAQQEAQNRMPSTLRGR